MKKAISFLMCVVFVLCMVLNFSVGGAEATTVAMQIDNSQMTVNGEVINIDERGSSPVIIGGRTLVPVRAMIEALGGTVGWEAETQTAILNYNNIEIRLVINSDTAYLNGESVTIDTKPVIIGSRTMLPARFIAESFGFGVEWDKESKTITIIKGIDVSDEVTTELTTEVTTELTTELTTEATTDTENVLVVYYSGTGNTESLAKTIHSVVGGDIVKVETVTPYTDDYNTLLDVAQNELNNNARPEISTVIDNIDDYDTVFIGYPVWWYIAPTIINTFLESYDFSDKTLVTFATSGGSGFGNTLNNLKPSCSESAKWVSGKVINHMSSGAIEQWIKELEL